MSTLVVATLKSNSSSPPAFQNTSGTEIGTLCRAWVNFNGTGTVAIRAQFNVSSITDNGTGDYTVNFTNASTDANYAVVGTLSAAPTGSTVQSVFSISRSTTAARVGTIGNAYYDNDYVGIAIFR
jgi:hypothetical protein